MLAPWSSLLPGALYFLSPCSSLPSPSLQEVEKQYKEGTSKAAIVAALKAAGPAGLTVAGVIEMAAGLGVKTFEDKQKPALQSALSTDPNFVRL